jgi:hypothetical protein
MKNIVGVLLLNIMFWSCQSETEKNQSEKYLRWVGDIEKNKQKDETDFEVCNGDESVYQYFHFGEGPVYHGEKSKIFTHFESKYKPISGDEGSGFIRIRFIVNCEGQAGRFRVLQSDENYQEKEFNTTIVSQLLDLTKGIDQWEVFYRNEKPVEYYMYLIFKVKNGQLIEILP